jgi:alkylated DNA repair protein alkB family protein 1
MGHQDRSEENSSAPLVSFSLGHSCIFLLGTEDRADKPIPIILESGDALLMYGNARRYFHGVPKVLENTLPLYLYPSKRATRDYLEKIDKRKEFLRIEKLEDDLELLKEEEDKDDWDIYGRYMLDSRINVNVRKVSV